MLVKILGTFLFKEDMGSCVKYYLDPPFVDLFQSSQQGQGQKWDKNLMIGLLTTQRAFDSNLLTDEMITEERKNNWSEVVLETHQGKEMYSITYTLQSSSASPSPKPQTEKTWWQRWSGRQKKQDASSDQQATAHTTLERESKRDAVAQLRDLAVQARSLASTASGHAPAELQSVARNLDEFATGLERGTHSEHLIGQSMRNMYVATYQDNAWLVPVVIMGRLDRNAINNFFDRYEKLMNSLL